MRCSGVFTSIRHSIRRKQRPALLASMAIGDHRQRFITVGKLDQGSILAALRLLQSVWPGRLRALALGPIRLNALLSQGRAGCRQQIRRMSMLFDGGYTYSNFLMNVLGIFAFVVWFWLLVVIYGDLFRR